MYEFAWRAPTFNGQLGACHVLEVPFAFDNLEEGGLRGLVGPNPPQELADTMHAAWVRFAETGDPGWPQCDVAGRQIMRFDITSNVVEDPRSTERRFWDR